MDYLKFGAVVNALYVCAGVALFCTGEAPVITPETDLLGDKFAMAWAGWKFSGCLYFALVNFGVSIELSNAVVMLPYIAFDVLAVLYDPENWTPLAWSFIVVEGVVLGLSAVAYLGSDPRSTKLARHVAALSNALYVLAGIALFATGEAPVITATASEKFLSDKFVRAWAGWKFSGCLYFALVNSNVSIPASNIITMIPYIAFDVFAVLDTEHWTSLAYSFIVLEALIMLFSVVAITNAEPSEVKENKTT